MTDILPIAIGVTDDGEGRTIWLLPDGTETATVCSCGSPYVPKGMHQKCCGAKPCQRRLEGRSPLRPRRCSQCNMLFSPKHSKHVTCSKRCQHRHDYLRKSADPEYRAAAKARHDKWLAEHKTERLATIAKRKKDRKLGLPPAFERWGPPRRLTP